MDSSFISVFISFLPLGPMVSFFRFTDFFWLLISFVFFTFGLLFFTKSYDLLGVSAVIASGSFGGVVSSFVFADL